MARPKTPLLEFCSPLPIRHATESHVFHFYPFFHPYNPLHPTCWASTWLTCVIFTSKPSKTPEYRTNWLMIMDLDHIPAYPPPPGVTPNFKNPVSLAMPLIVVNVVFISLMAIFVVLRIYTKHFIVCKLWWDDCRCYSFRCSTVTCSHVKKPQIHVYFPR